MQKILMRAVAFLKKYRIRSAIVLLVIILITANTIKNKNEAPSWTTDTVSQGSVRNVISVSGSVDAVGTAELAFPTGGILESISVKEGDVVKKGQVLATLAHNDLKADYADAEAALIIAKADRDELVNGIRDEERAISLTTAEIAKEELERVKKEQQDLVTNAYRTLLSSDLEARPKRSSNNDTPPTVTGTYTCSEGTYTLSIYGSGAKSGHSYRLSGIENGAYTAYTESAAPLGTCGLRIQFASDETYASEEWEIAIPNKAGATYTANLNAYTLALTKQRNAVREAEQNLRLAEQNAALDIAAPRAEDRTREDAKVLQAQARLNVVGSQIRDHVLIAPFDGTITKVDPVPGESLGTTPIITMVSNEAFALNALIPEIDITKITTGQKAEVTFDARQQELLPASVVFISPLAEEIDGVSYFEAKLMLDNEVSWLRSGLNADVDIIVETQENVTRVPKRYVTYTANGTVVLVPQGKETREVPVTVTFTGNDGFVAVSGIEPGATIVAP